MKGRRRLLFLTDDFGGGTGNHLLSLMERWEPAGWDLEIATTAAQHARRDPPVRFTRLPPPWIDRYPLHHVQRLFQVRRLIRDRRPDLVHAYFFWTVLYARLLKLAGEIPVLVENREDEGFDWGRHEYALLRMTGRAPDRVVCVSESVRRVVLEREGLEPARTEVIRNGVAEPPQVSEGRREDLREELGLPPGAPVVGMVANLNRMVKGGSRLLDILPGIVERVPGARFVIAGKVPTGSDFPSRLRATGLGEQVVLAGYREDIHALYSLMDVSVLTSDTEGLSITILESMIHGVPVVATRVGGNPEVVVSGEHGFLVPLDEPDAFAGRVADLLRDDELRARLGRAARRRIRDEFGIEGTAERYARLYRELLGGGDGPSPSSPKAGGSVPG